MPATVDTQFQFVFGSCLLNATTNRVGGHEMMTTSLGKNSGGWLLCSLCVCLLAYLGHLHTAMPDALRFSLHV